MSVQHAMMSDFEKFSMLAQSFSELDSAGGVICERTMPRLTRGTRHGIARCRPLLTRSTWAMSSEDL